MSSPASVDQEARNAAIGRRCVVIAAVLWSLSGVITKRLPGVDGPTIAFYRGLFAGLSLLPLVPRRSIVFRPSMLPLVFIFAGMTAVYISSVTLTTAANAIFLQYSSALWTVPASLLILRERPDRRTIAGSVVAAIGIGLIVVLNRGQGGPNDRLGILLGLGSGLGYGLVAVLMRGLRDVNAMWLSVVNNLGGALVLGAGLALVRGGLPVPSATELLILFLFGAIQMAIPYALFARGLRDISAPEAGLITLVEPLLNPLWVWLFVREVPEFSTFLGGTFLLAGVAIRYVPFWSSKR